jgi:hypothetical protein
MESSLFEIRALPSRWQDENAHKIVKEPVIDRGNPLKNQGKTVIRGEPVFS